MTSKVLLAAAAFSMMAAVPFAAQAMPAPASALPDAPISLVAGGCGPGFHRGPWGGCRPNRGWRRAWRPRCFVEARRTPWGWRHIRVCR